MADEPHLNGLLARSVPEGLESEKDLETPVLRFPVLYRGKTLVITAQEKDLIDHFVYTQDLRESARKVVMPAWRAKEFLESDRMKAYVEYRVSMVAARNSITLESILHRLGQIAFGVLKVTRPELEALKMLAEYVKILKPAGTQILNVNNGGQKAESFDDARLDDELRKRGLLTEDKAEEKAPEAKVLDGEANNNGEASAS